MQYLLNIEADEERAEAELTELAVEKIELDTPPHDLHDFQSLHRELFEGDDESAGELCGIEMLTAGAIRFCT